MNADWYKTVLQTDGVDYPTQLAGIYAGEIFEYRGFAEMRAIIDFTRAFLEQQLAPFPPTEIHRHLAADELADRLKAVSKRYRTESRLKPLWHAFYRAVGIPAATHAEDRVILRFHIPDGVIPGDAYAPVIKQVPPHRDTWGSNLYAQLNWWAPVYPLAPNRTFSIAPGYWDKKIANTTPGFDMREAIQAAANPGPDTKLSDIVPVMTAPYPFDDAFPVLIEPGDILGFSGQHLHAGVPNTSDQTRISLDTRTISIEDVQQGIGAPNIDGEAKLIALNLFKRISDGRPMHEVLGLPQLMERYRRQLASQY